MKLVGEPMTFSDDTLPVAARKTGIEAMNYASWGTHFCLLYETREDLIDVFVPYLRAGLENGEGCLWITSELLGQDEAAAAIEEQVPDFRQYVRKKQLSITPYSEQYLKDRVFDRQRVIDSWIGRYNEILGQGYGGMRLAADLSWLKRKDWKDFTEYEKQANDTFRSLRTLALCAYWLKRFSVSELIDIMRNHCLLLIRQYGRWISLDRSSITTPTRQLTPLQRAFLRAGFEGLNDQGILTLNYY